MSSININKNEIVFEDFEGRQIKLMNLTNFLENKSRVPMHTLDCEVETIHDFLLRIFNRNIALFPMTSEMEQLRIIVTDCIITAKLLRRSTPVRVAELGSTEGKLSNNLAEILSKFHPDSHLCLVSNTIGNESENRCLDAVMSAGNIPDFSMVYADYHKTNLADNLFDIVILNGTAGFENPYEVIKEAERLTKNNGLILCCTADDSLLASNFSLIFGEREEYRLAPNDAIMTVVLSEPGWEKAGKEKLADGLQGMLESVREAKRTMSLSKARECMENLDEYIKQSSFENNVEAKLLLLWIKEELVECMEDGNKFV